MQTAKNRPCFRDKTQSVFLMSAILSIKAVWDSMVNVTILIFLKLQAFLYGLIYSGDEPVAFEKGSCFR